MLHTFVGDDAAQAREQARVPFCNYIRGNIGLLNGLAQSRGQSVDVRAMGARELDEFVEFLYERFAQSRGPSARRKPASTWAGSRVDRCG